MVKNKKFWSVCLVSLVMISLLGLGIFVVAKQNAKMRWDNQAQSESSTIRNIGGKSTFVLNVSDPAKVLAGKASPDQHENKVPPARPQVQTENVPNTHFVNTGTLKIPVLMYHHIDTLERIPKTDTIGIGLRVSPNVFEKQLQYIQNKGYHTINSNDLYEYALNKSELPTIYMGR